MRRFHYLTCASLVLFSWLGLSLEKGLAAETWKTVFEDDFNRAAPGSNWKPLAGQWEIKEGRLYGSGEAQIVSGAEYPGLHRLEFDCGSENPGDLSALLQTNEKGLAGGYFLGFGSNGNTKNKILVAGRDSGAVTTTPLIRKGKTHHVIAEMDNGRVTLSVDGQKALESQEDPHLWPDMVNEGHRKFGLYISASGWVDNLKLSTKPASLPQLAAAPAVRGPLPHITNSIGMEMVQVPAGTFAFGINNPRGSSLLVAGSEARKYKDVTLSQPFFIGTSEVTQQQYREIMGVNPSFFAYGTKTAQYPVDSVSWYQAVEFCDKLSKKEGKRYRLPTSAEWEYAYRAGTRTRFYFGDDATQIADYGWLEPPDGKRKLDYPKFGTIPVKQLKPNAWGLYDMIGNVQEWVQDWENYDAEYYDKMPTTDPSGPPAGFSKVLRGGTLNYPAAAGGATAGMSYVPDAQMYQVGFRIVCEVGPVK